MLKLTAKHDETARYLAETSPAGIADFFLSRLAKERKLMKDLEQLMDEIAENRAWIITAQFKREYPELYGGRVRR
jgi:hypothetical protein